MRYFLFSAFFIVSPAAFADEIIAASSGSVRNFSAVWEAAGLPSEQVVELSDPDVTSLLITDFFFISETGQDREFEKSVASVGAILYATGANVPEGFDLNDPASVVKEYFSTESKSGMTPDVLAAWSSQPASSVPDSMAEVALGGFVVTSQVPKFGTVEFARAFQNYRSMDSGILAGYQSANSSELIAFLQDRLNPGQAMQANRQDWTQKASKDALIYQTQRREDVAFSR